MRQFPIAPTPRPRQVDGILIQPYGELLDRLWGGEYTSYVEDTNIAIDTLAEAQQREWPWRA